MHNIQIRLEDPRWARCDCDSHLMKPPGPAASIWLRLPSYNTCQATWAPGPSLITDNERKERRENGGLIDRERDRGWEREIKAPAVLFLPPLWATSTAVSSAPPKGILLACVLNLRIALNLRTHRKNKAKTSVLFCITDRRGAKSKASAY